MKRLSFFVFPLLLLLPALTVAQSEAAIKLELTRFLQDFGKAYVNLPVSKDRSTVMKFLSPDANYSIYSYNIAGKSRIQTLDSEDFDLYLSEVARTEGITLGYEVRDQHFTFVSPDLATFVYTVKYETKVENGIWVRGDETVTMSTAKKNGEWKIVYFSIVQVEDERLKGNCLCELFAAAEGDTEVVAKMTIPAGRAYETTFVNLNFRTVGDDLFIRNGGAVYKRNKAGEIFSVTDAGQEKIGAATTRREVAMLVLQHSFRSNCSKLSPPTR
jgi:hypothetical protein